MNKIVLAPLALIMLACPLKANTTDGLLIGGALGLTAGFIGSAIARSTQPDVVVVEEPVYVERPVYVQDPRVNEKKAELAWREQNLRKAEMKQYNKEIARRAQEEEMMRRRAEEAHAQKQKQQRVVEKTIIETRTVAKDDSDIKKQELAIKQQELELELIKAKKELLQEENRKKELAIKEAAQKQKPVETITKTVSIKA